MLLPIAPLAVIALFSLLMALVFLLFAPVMFRKRRLLAGLNRLVAGLLLLCLAALSALLALGAYGFRVFTNEQVAATVAIEKQAAQQFLARFSFPDGEVRQFTLAGDELYVDARILKWHPYANLLGLRTLYALDRVSGRYILLDDEQTKARTVFTLSQEPVFDLFQISKRLPALKTLVDASYGSSTFTPVDDNATYQISVSTTGLLVRRLE